MSKPSLSAINPENPAVLGFPPGLPVELVMGLNSIKKICEGYGITREDYDALCENPVFAAQITGYLDMKEETDGMFKLQAKLMSYRALDEQFKMMVDKEIAPALRLKASENIIQYGNMVPKQSDADSGPKFSISINMQNLAPQLPATTGHLVLEHE